MLIILQNKQLTFKITTDKNALHNTTQKYYDTKLRALLALKQEVKSMSKLFLN